MNYKILSTALLVVVIGMGAYLVIAKQSQNDDATIPVLVNSNINTNTTPINQNRNTNTSQQSTTQTLPTGQIKLSGRFSEYGYGLAPEVLSFNVESDSTNPPTGSSFNFLNQTFAHTAFKTADAGRIGYPGCDAIDGRAEIIVSGYKTADTTMSESFPTATLVSVIKITQPAGCGRTKLP